MWATMHRDGPSGRTGPLRSAEAPTCARAAGSGDAGLGAVSPETRGRGARTSLDRVVAGFRSGLPRRPAAPGAGRENRAPLALPVRAGEIRSADASATGRDAEATLRLDGPPGGSARWIAPTRHARRAGNWVCVHPFGPSISAPSGGAVAGIFRLFYDASSESRSAA